MIREKLCKAVKDFKIINKLTYLELSELSGLNKTQLINIIRNNGAEVKLERIESAIYLCGMDVRMEVVL